MLINQQKLIKEAGILVFLISFIACGEKKTSDKPNIVYIMIDDLGYGDIGCYGSEVNNTPNIDSLANHGMLLTDYHSNGPMCTPTRAALMSGKYQHRYGKKFETALSVKRHGDQGLPLGVYTIAEALNDAGYSTGMYGKWHLGYQEPFLPANQGFDDFIGLLSGDGDHHTHINRWGQKDWWHNNEIAMEDGYAEDLITNHSIDFIKAHKNEPFFLYVSHLAIHFPWQGPEDPPHRKAGKTYPDDKWGIILNPDNVHPHVNAMIEAVDKGVGKIMETLKRLDLEKNTLVIFTSDNGGYIHYDHKFFNISNNGPLRGQKTQVYEGGHRVPFIAYWPGKISQGSVSDETVMTMDMYPTFTELAGAEIPDTLQLDGRSILPVLFKNKSLSERAVCWKAGNAKAIRKGKWKLIKHGDDKAELYNLSDDIGEENNVAQYYPDIVRRLTDQYNKWENQVTQNYR
jgi:arylsulfatase A-like enzyme